MLSRIGTSGRVLAVAAIAMLLVLAAAGTASAQDGGEIYSTSCSSCHGPDGTGMLPGQPDFTDPATWEGVSEEEVVTFVKDDTPRIEGVGGEGNGMQPDGGSSLTDAERQAVVQYVMGLAEGGEGGEGGGHEEKPMPDTTLTLFEELPPHEIGVVSIVVLMLVMGIMFGVNRFLSEG